MLPRSNALRENPELVRGVLDVISREPTVTQRRLSRELGVALGVANAVLRRCVVKGLIKIKQAPIRRYGYYLTPEGFSEKSRLTLEYFNISFRLFRDARDQYAAIFRRLAGDGMQRILLAGAGDLAEIALLSAQAQEIEIVGCVAPPDAAPLPGVARRSTVAEFAGTFDAIVLCDIVAAGETYRRAVGFCAVSGHPAGRVLAPPLLRIAAEVPTSEEPQ